MIKKFYAWLLRKSARPSDGDGVSSGRWQAMVRDAALRYCEGASGRLLEVGCGEGLFISRAAGNCPGLYVCGIDISLSQLRTASKRAGERGVRAGLSVSDALKLPFKEGSFDTIVAVNLLLNLSPENVERLIREMARILKPGGRIVFDVRNRRNLLVRIKYLLAPLYDGTIAEKRLLLNSFYPEEIERMAESADLAVRSRAGIGFPSANIAPIIIFETAKEVGR